MNFKNNIIKPILAGILMAIAIFVIQTLLKEHINNLILTVGNVLVGAIVYIISIAFLKILSKEEILLLPMGERIYFILKKFKIYV